MTLNDSLHETSFMPEANYSGGGPPSQGMSGLDADIQQLLKRGISAASCPETGHGFFENRIYDVKIGY
jgi:hypothetical protein